MGMRTLTLLWLLGRVSLAQEPPPAEIPTEAPAVELPPAEGPPVVEPPAVEPPLIEGPQVKEPPPPLPDATLELLPLVEVEAPPAEPEGTAIERPAAAVEPPPQDIVPDALDRDAPGIDHVPRLIQRLAAWWHPSPAPEAGAEPAGPMVADAEIPAALARPDAPLRELVVVETPAAPSFLPEPPHLRHGFGRALAFLLGAVLVLGVARMSRRGMRRLPTRGLIPLILRTTTLLGRGVFVPLIILGLYALTPEGWGWAEPAVLAAAAAAIGWTARDLLADLFAGVILGVDRSVEVNQRVEIDGEVGTVTDLGLRIARVRLDDGRILTLPNHLLASRVLRIDPDHYAPVTVPVRVPGEWGVGEVRKQLEELALLSPYVAPTRPPRVFRDPNQEAVWMVEARLVHASHAPAFSGALVELADEIFGSGASSKPQDRPAPPLRES